MKRINIVLSTFAFVILTFSAILLVSCNKGSTTYNDTTLTRPCDNVICLNGGACTDGFCYCPQGFEGVQCATKWSDKFVGNFIADDACDTSSAGFYNSVINADPAYAYKLRLFNVSLFCPGTVIYASINPEKTSFTIPMQQTCGDLYLSGYGNINGNYINVFLSSRDTIAHVTEQCSVLLNRQ